MSAWMAQHVAAGRLHFGRRLPDRLGLQGGDDHLAARGAELLGDDAAQAAGTAGDQGDFVLPETHGDRGPGGSNRQRVRRTLLSAHEGVGLGVVDELLLLQVPADLAAQQHGDVGHVAGVDRVSG